MLWLLVHIANTGHIAGLSVEPAVLVMSVLAWVSELRSLLCSNLDDGHHVRIVGTGTTVKPETIPEIDTGSIGL